MRLTLTFKESEKWLYDEIIKHSGKGNWIKDVLMKELKKEVKEKPIEDDFSIFK